MLADHLVTECVLALKKPKTPLKSVSFRNFNKINLSQFQDTLNTLFSNDDIDVDNVISNTVNCFDNHCPVQVKRIKVKPKKIIASRSTKALIKQNKQVYKVHTRQPSSCTTARLHVLKRQIKAATRKDTKNPFGQVICEKGFWEGFINTFSPKHKQSITNNLSPDQINDFYIEITKKSYTNSTFPELPSTVLREPFEFKTLSPVFIKSIWKTMKNPLSKSPDPLGISAFMINLCMQNDNFVNTMTKVFNRCINTGIIPSILKLSRVVPVPKVDNPNHPNQTDNSGLERSLVPLMHLLH